MTTLFAMKTYVAIGLLVFALRSFAEPGPFGLMIKGNQCARYWPGDECVSYKLPPGWKDIYPGSTNQTITYQGKTCVFDTTKAEECCKKLGLRFIDRPLEKDLSQKAAAFCQSK